MGEDIEVAEKIGVHPRADDQAVGAADPDSQSLEYLAHLCQEIPLRRIADGEKDTRFLPVPFVLFFLHVKEETVMPFALLV